MVKALVGLALIGVSVATYFTGRIWIYPGALGFVLLLWAIGGGGGNKGGYNF